MILTAKYVNNKNRLLTMKIKQNRYMKDYFTRLKTKHDWENIELSVEIKKYYKLHTDQMRKLYWLLLERLAYICYDKHGYTDYVHEEILKLYSPKIQSKLTNEKIPKRSKHLCTYDYSKLIEGVFLELAERGADIEDPDDIRDFYLRWHEARWQNGGDIMQGKYKNVEDYREKNPVAECCQKLIEYEHGKYVFGSGNIAHIISRGAGGTDEDWNLLHLCQEHHITVQHQRGWSEFILQFPHLEKKIKRALKCK